MRIEPAFATAPKRAERQAGNVEPTETLCERSRIHQHDIGAFGPLYHMVRRESFPAGRAREQQITALAKCNIGIRTEALFQFAEKCDSEPAHPDVLRCG